MQEGFTQSSLGRLQNAAIIAMKRVTMSSVHRGGRPSRHAFSAGKLLLRSGKRIEHVDREHLEITNIACNHNQPADARGSRDHRIFQQCI